MKGFLYFIIVVCGIYVLCPDPMPFWFDDFVVFGILILAAIGVKKLPSNKDDNSNYDEEEEEEDKSSTTIYNYNSPGRTISLDCSNCGASLELDPDNLIARCPYCNHKILLDTNHLGQLITERGRIRREEEKTLREKEITERENLKYQFELEKQRMEIQAKERAEKRMHIALIALLIFTIIFFFILPRLVL